MLSADVMNCASDCRGGVQPSIQGLSREVNGFLMNWSLGESSSSHCMETSHWLSVYLIVYIYLYSSHNKYTMAFKIKSAKIFFFFFGIKEHTVMLLLVVLPCLSTHWAATGRQQEEETRLCHTQILQVNTGCVTPGGMAVSHSLEENTRQQSVRPGGDTTASTPNQAGLTSSGFSV